MRIPKSGRVLVIDDDPRVLEDIQAMLDGTDCMAEGVIGRGQRLVTEAKKKAKAFRPHVAVIDLALIDDPSDRMGLELLDSLGPACCIIYSAHLDIELTRRLRDEYGVDYFSKSEPPEHLLKAIRDGLHSHCAGFCGFMPQFPHDFDATTIVRVLLDESMRPPCECVQDVLRQLFPEVTRLSLTMLSGQETDLQSVSRGHSFVAMGHPQGGVSVVVKFAPVADMYKEARNYRDYVEDKLGGRFYAQLKEHILSWELGGATYAFIGNVSAQAAGSHPFRQFYRSMQKAETILQPLDYFFRAVWGVIHYSKPRMQKGCLFDAYNRDLALADKLEAFPDTCRIRLPGFAHPLINPISWVQSHINKSPSEWYEAITHGDLHADNLFVDGVHAWAIDFERTGPGHILRDFAELEVDILTRLAFPAGQTSDSTPLYQLLELLKMLLRPEALNPETHSQDCQPVLGIDGEKARSVVMGLRKIANDVTGCDDAREYYWALLFDAVFVACLVREDSPQRERALLLGAALCKRLSMVPGDVWPPSTTDTGWLAE